MLKLILMVYTQKKSHTISLTVQHPLAVLKKRKTSPPPVRHFNNYSVTKYFCFLTFESYNVYKCISIYLTSYKINNYII